MNSRIGSSLLALLAGLIIAPTAMAQPVMNVVTWTWNTGSPALVATTGGLKLNASGRVTYTRASGNAKVTINKVEFLVYKGVAGTNGYEADPITIQDPTLGAVTDPVPSPTTSYQTVTAEPVKNGSGETIVFPAGTKIKVEVRIKYTVTDSDGVSAAPVTTVTLSKAAIED
jgi:hypothetical protein